MRFIRKIERYLPKSFQKRSFYQYSVTSDKELLVQLGFSFPFINYEVIIPKSNFNKVTSINSNGKEIIRKDLPKDKHTIYHDFEAPNFGDSTKGTHTVTFSRTIEKYKREHTLPFSLTFMLYTEDFSTFYIYSKIFKYDNVDNEELTFAYNLFKNIFGQVNFSLDNKIDKDIIIIKKQWEFLKHGTRQEKIDRLMEIVTTKKLMKDKFIKKDLIIFYHYQ